MRPALVVAAWWALFGGTHVLPATRRARAALVARLGELGFTAAYWVVAALTFAGLVHAYAMPRFAGARDRASAPSSPSAGS